MGVAKRRRQADPDRDRYRFRNNRDPNIRAMFGKEGSPINVALVGSGLIMALAATGLIPIGVPGAEAAAVRRAFGLWDRIRTGELEPWPCALCERRHVGLDELSCIGVITPMDATPKTPGIMLSVCQRCDSVSTEHTKHRITTMFPMTNAGRA